MSSADQHKGSHHCCCLLHSLSAVRRLADRVQFREALTADGVHYYVYALQLPLTAWRRLGWAELLLRWIGPLGYSLKHQPVGMWLDRGQLIEQRLIQLLEFPFSETELVTVAADIVTCKVDCLACSDQQCVHCWSYSQPVTSTRYKIGSGQSWLELVSC